MCPQTSLSLPLVIWTDTYTESLVYNALTFNWDEKWTMWHFVTSEWQYLTTQNGVGLTIRNKQMWYDWAFLWHMNLGISLLQIVIQATATPTTTKLHSFAIVISMWYILSHILTTIANECNLVVASVAVACVTICNKDIPKFMCRGNVQSHHVCLLWIHICICYIS